MSVKLGMLRRCCLVAGAGLILWMSAEFFLLAFLTSRFMEGAGVVLWMRGYWEAFRSSPVSIAGVLLLIVGTLSRRAG